VVNVYVLHCLQDLPLPANVTCIKENDKIIAQEIEWLPTYYTPFRTFQIVEVFSIVTVELSRCPQSLKVKTRLLRPRSQKCVSNKVKSVNLRRKKKSNTTRQQYKVCESWLGFQICCKYQHKNVSH
jgi:hypothetical protein